MKSSALEIKQLVQDQFNAWDAFVFNHPQATFFHRAGWKSVIERSFGHKAHYIYALNNGVIEGVLPLVHVKSLLFGNALVSTPFCVYGGIVASNSVAHDALAQHAVKLSQQLGVDHLELRNIARQFSDWPTKDLYVTFRKSIDPDPDVNMKAIPRKQRAMVRKAIDQKLQSHVDENVDNVYTAYSESVRNLGTPVFSKNYFKVLKEVFGEDCENLIITAPNGELIAGVMSFYFRNEVIPYYGGGTAKARDVKGNDFLYWELMRRSCERGIKVFDYGRSKQGTGSYSFKKNWGFEPQPLHYEYHLVNAKQVPDINPLNPKYKLFIAAWKKLPVVVSNRIGPFLAKDLG